MSVFLMSRWGLLRALEPLRQMSADLSNANEIRLLIHDMVFAYSSRSNFTFAHGRIFLYSAETNFCDCERLVFELGINLCDFQNVAFIWDVMPFFKEITQHCNQLLYYNCVLLECDYLMVIPLPDVQLVAKPLCPLFCSVIFRACYLLLFSPV